MHDKEIENILDDLYSSDFPFGDFNNRLKEEKQRRLRLADEEGAKKIWVYQAICRVHKCYREMFDLLRRKEFYSGWCSLVDAEETFEELNRHFGCESNPYSLYYILERIRDIQLIFPYVWFTSVAINSNSTLCTICNKPVSFRNSCGHVPGEIYDGKMCNRRMVDSKLVHLAFTETPVKRKMVAIGRGRDHHNYDAIRELFGQLETPYEKWDLRNGKQVFAERQPSKSGRNKDCFCGSGKKYKKCHLNNNGNRCFRYDLYKNDLFACKITVFKEDRMPSTGRGGKNMSLQIMSIDEEWE